ncbi:DUF2112 family protein [uncultured Methanobrevibacter sp.]|uniref:DUF2112 family protein n=1 Tax=uncultured Methanobrevibacter sp. TaxID=253161 RepID=UPI0025CDBE91|nr:DUF2112 family protein [uncultured Methanobrevibacter sp.]
MNVIVIPDGAMIVVPLIEKNGHTYLSPTNFSKYDNEVNLNPNFKVNMSSETPSGVRGRISLLMPLLDKADAAIVLGQRPENYEPMYDVLNELILFCGNGCNNAHSLAVSIVSQLDIPVLKLDYPTAREDIIKLIDKVNLFLKDFDSSIGDDLDADLRNKSKKVSLDEFEKIIGNSY